MSEPEAPDGTRQPIRSEVLFLGPAEGNRLGDILVHRGSCSRETLERALTGREDEDPRPIGEYLVTCGVIAEQDLRAALAEQLRQFGRVSDILGARALAAGLITETQHGRALREQRRRFARGERPALGKVLLDLGFLTPVQLDRILLEPGHGSPGTGAPAGTNDPGHGPFPRPWGRYTLLGVMGRGAMGVVLKAHDPVLRREVALKACTSSDPKARRRFIEEPARFAKVGHPHVVEVYETGEVVGRPFFTMPLLADSLARRVKAEDGLAPAEAARIIEAVARGVHAAHGQGIIHRDLKPSNVLLDAEGRPRVADFGIAGDVTSDVRLTQTGATLGTPGYMPPEQWEGDTDRLDAISDVYALGATLYEACTATLPFTGKNQVEICRQTLDPAVAPEPPSHLSRHRIPWELDAITLRALAKDRRRRYASAEAMADDLRRFQDGEPLARETHGQYRWRRAYVARKWLAKRRAPVAVAGVGLAATLAALLWMPGWHWASLVKARRTAQALEAEAGETARTLLSERAQPSEWDERMARFEAPVVANAAVEACEELPARAQDEALRVAAHSAYGTGAWATAHLAMAGLLLDPELGVARTAEAHRARLSHLAHAFRLDEQGPVGRGSLLAMAEDMLQDGGRVAERLALRWVATAEGGDPDRPRALRALAHALSAQRLCGKALGVLEYALGLASLDPRLRTILETEAALCRGFGGPERLRMPSGTVVGLKLADGTTAFAFNDGAGFSVQRVRPGQWELVARFDSLAGWQDGEWLQVDAWPEGPAGWLVYLRNTGEIRLYPPEGGSRALATGSTTAPHGSTLANLDLGNGRQPYLCSNPTDPGHTVDGEPCRLFVCAVQGERLVLRPVLGGPRGTFSPFSNYQLMETPGGPLLAAAWSAWGGYRVDLYKPDQGRFRRVYTGEVIGDVVGLFPASGGRLGACVRPHLANVDYEWLFGPQPHPAVRFFRLEGERLVEEPEEALSLPWGWNGMDTHTMTPGMFQAGSAVRPIETAYRLYQETQDGWAWIGTPADALCELDGSPGLEAYRYDGETMLVWGLGEAAPQAFVPPAGSGAVRSAGDLLSFAGLPLPAARAYSAVAANPSLPRDERAVSARGHAAALAAAYLEDRSRPDRLEDALGAYEEAARDFPALAPELGLDRADFLVRCFRFEEAIQTYRELEAGPLRDWQRDAARRLATTLERELDLRELARFDGEEVLDPAVWRVWGAPAFSRTQGGVRQRRVVCSRDFLGTAIRYGGGPLALEVRLRIERMDWGIGAIIWAGDPYALAFGSGVQTNHFSGNFGGVQPGVIVPVRCGARYDVGFSLVQGLGLARVRLVDADTGATLHDGASASTAPAAGQTLRIGTGTFADVGWHLGDTFRSDFVVESMVLRAGPDTRLLSPEELDALGGPEGKAGALWLAGRPAEAALLFESGIPLEHDPVPAADLRLFAGAAWAAAGEPDKAEAAFRRFLNETEHPLLGQRILAWAWRLSPGALDELAETAGSLRLSDDLIAPLVARLTELSRSSRQGDRAGALAFAPLVNLGRALGRTRAGDPAGWLDALRSAIEIHADEHAVRYLEAALAAGVPADRAAAAAAQALLAGSDLSPHPYHRPELRTLAIQALTTLAGQPPAGAESDERAFLEAVLLAYALRFDEAATLLVPVVRGVPRFSQDAARLIQELRRNARNLEEWFVPRARRMEARVYAYEAGLFLDRPEQREKLLETAVQALEWGLDKDEHRADPAGWLDDPVLAPLWETGRGRAFRQRLLE